MLFLFFVLLNCDRVFFCKIFIEKASYIYAVHSKSSHHSVLCPKALGEKAREVLALYRVRDFSASSRAAPLGHRETKALAVLQTSCEVADVCALSPADEETVLAT